MVHASYLMGQQVLLQNCVNNSNGANSWSGKIEQSFVLPDTKKVVVTKIVKK